MDRAGIVRPAVELPSPLDRWEEISGRLTGHRPVVFLDFDGTLSPIAPRPDEAELPGETRAILERLSAVAPVAVLSGRGREDVAARMGLEGIVYAGSHGLDIAGPNGLEHQVAGDLAPLIGEVAARLEAAVGEIPGALVEPKGLTVAVHYRQVPAEFLEELESRVAGIVQKHPELERKGGRKVFEIRPALDWHKGKALLWLLEELNLDGDSTLPFYLGDDETDEDAFRALEGRGVGILVAETSRPTAAGYRLADPAEVGRFLERLARHLEDRENGSR